ncbi:MAG: chromosomal replication initiator protein DnaA [Clostridiales bacterium]|nr:chromosomal replication initiator protein DnaA [Clostridiales bacterium]
MVEKEQYEILWEQTFLPEIEKHVTSISFETHVKQLTPVDILGNKIVLITPSRIFADAINNHPIGVKMREAFSKCNTYINDFEIIVAQSKEEYVRQLDEEDRDRVSNQGMPINPKFTFDSFVVGSSNEFIFAAAKAVAENPGDAYNPLFIHGGTGLGKTHILMAIANYLKVHNPTLNVLYATCEQFTNQLVESISKGKALKTEEFRRRYRNVDVLLIDDVQFLAQKQATQSEFFHTFNELVMQNKQIVLTCDRPPQEIEVLEDRLKTRFEGGLIGDVQPPDLETKIAILKRKAEEQKCIVNIKVLSYIAQMNISDIRTLIGKLTKVIFASKLHERPITIELVNEALKESAGERQEELKADDIISCVCNFYKVSKADLLSKKKTKEVALARQVGMYLVLDMMSLPQLTVGKIFSRDHATVIYARDKIAEQMETDTRLSTAVGDIKKMLLKQ